ncbi:hypothetical protein Scani_32960 [Streptomyces caniferus]|uniref:Uncharacterized protein n=1 Tax=Streptomyces caniferus TaxID=285557 RepID=A0A640S7J0_9ACTN|nr:hypothetical protein Scani_32960 [Streptomyces caniferus]
MRDLHHGWAGRATSFLTGGSRWCSCRADRGSLDQHAPLEAGPGMDQRDEVGAFTARHHSWADSTSLKTITKAGDVLPAPLVTFVRSRTVAKVDSMGFVVRRWIQCSAGSRKTRAVRPRRR